MAATLLRWARFFGRAQKYHGRSSRPLFRLIVETLEGRYVPSASAIVPLNAAVDSMSADGRFIAEESHAVVPNVYSTFLSLDDRRAGTKTTLGASGVVSNQAVVSADGRFTAFVSGHYGFGGHVAAVFNVFLYDQVAGTTTLVSSEPVAPPVPGLPTPGADNSDPRISADGRFITFESTDANLVPAQINNSTGSGEEVFLYDRLTGTVTLVSHSISAAATTANADAKGAVISADGNYIAFESWASDLAPGQNAPIVALNVFLYDRVAGTTTLVTHKALGGSISGQPQTGALSISSDGRFVSYSSSATDLVANLGGPPNGESNVYLYDRLSGTNVLVSHSNASGTVTGNLSAVLPVLSLNGNFIAFESKATDLLAGPVPGGNNVFLYDRVTGESVLVSKTIGAGQVDDSVAPSINGDGSRVAFVSVGGPLVAAGERRQQVVLYRTETQSDEIVYQQAYNTPPGPSHPELGQISNVGISQNGAFVAYSGLWRVPFATQGPIFYTGGWLWAVSTNASSTSLVGRDAGTGQWWVSGSSGTSSATSQLVDAWNPDVSWVNVQTGDFTGDGSSDIVGMVQQTGQWFVGVPDGQGHFITREWDAWNPAYTWKVWVGDFNGDGKDDIVGLAMQTGQWFVGVSNGTSFTTSQWDAWNANVPWTHVMVGDVTGNGKADIVACAKDSGQWWVGASTGSSFHTTLWDAWNPNVSWVNVQLGDFNGDGRMDLVGRAQESGQWWVGLSTGSSFQTSLWDAWSTAVTWVDVKVGDFNGDGKADIVGRALENGQWWCGLSNGTGFQTSLWDAWSTGVTWVDVQVGDFNGGGLWDIAGRAKETGQWFVGLSKGQAFSTSVWDAWNPSVSWADVQVVKLA